MNKILLNIKLLYDSLGKSEKCIADWLYEHYDELISLSITELAEKSNSSEATIVRFAKRLGYSGYQEMKISFAQETNASTISTVILPTDNTEDVFSKVCNDIYCSLEMTKKVLNYDSLTNVCESIIAANKIVVFGLGNSASVALDASHKLLRAGCNAFSYSDNHMQAIAASHLKKGDVAIGISHSGSSKDIVDALSTAKKAGATTVCITNSGKSPIQKHSDFVLFTSSEETKHNILALNSRIAQLSIVNAIYYYIVYHQPERALNFIHETERSLLSKKY